MGQGVLSLCKMLKNVNYVNNMIKMHLTESFLILKFMDSESNL